MKPFYLLSVETNEKVHHQAFFIEHWVPVRTLWVGGRWFL